MSYTTQFPHAKVTSGNPATAPANDPFTGILVVSASAVVSYTSLKGDSATDETHYQGDVIPCMASEVSVSSGEVNAYRVFKEV